MDYYEEIGKEIDETPIGRPRSKEPATLSNEQRYFDALKRISKFHTVDQIKRRSRKQWGLEPEEGVEMAYENVIYEAKQALGKRRRPQ